MSKCDEICKDIRNMSNEEYIESYESMLGYSLSEIPVSEFKRIVKINRCKDCPNLHSDGEYMVTNYYKCEKMNKVTKEWNTACVPKEIMIELFNWFETCTVLDKE